MQGPREGRPGHGTVPKGSNPKPEPKQPQKEKGGKGPKVIWVYQGDRVWGNTPTCTRVQTHCHAKHECVSYLSYLNLGESLVLRKPYRPTLSK